MDELEFWRECCRRGITVCHIPKPFMEHERVWLVVKQETFADPGKWKASHTFDSMEDVFLWVGGYLENGIEPKSRAEGRN